MKCNRRQFLVTLLILVSIRCQELSKSAIMQCYTIQLSPSVIYSVLFNLDKMECVGLKVI